MKETSRHRDAFEAWYGQSRNFRKITESLGIKSSTLYDWADRFDWHERADNRDAMAQEYADVEAAKDRAARQKKRRQAGELMSMRGMEFFAQNKIDSAKDAIQAIKGGTEIERREDGVPDWVIQILNADPNELEKLARDIANLDASAEAEGGGDDPLSLEADAQVD